MPDRALPAPFHWQGDHVAAELAGGRVLFTTRRGGVSAGAFSSLNVGARTGDDPARVRANRVRLGALAGLGWERFCHGRQVHGATVRRAGEPPGAGRVLAEEDGQATALRDAAAVVFAADCLPVALVADGAVAALHGGWRGLAAGVVREGVRALRDLGAVGPISAALGPAARGCCYEVGPEVLARFDPAAARRGPGRLDLAAVAARQLADAGVDEVHDVGLCTICADPKLFFSHRRDRGVTGRQALVAWRA